MALFGRRGSASLDEFVGSGEERAASQLDLAAGARAWQERLARLGRVSEGPASAELHLGAFSLVRGGDLFERRAKRAQPRTSCDLLDQFTDVQIRLSAHRAAAPERDAALDGVLRVLSGNPALCKRMMIAKAIRLVIVPKGRDFREYAFPPHTNPRALGIFWNSAREEEALLGLREEFILEKPWLMVHEMTHAVHLLGFTQKERDELDGMLMPVYRSKRWVEEAMAIYAERAFGAEYTEAELEAPDLYGKTRRDWREAQVFARFVAELTQPP